MLLIVFDHLGIRQLFAIMMWPGFPDISRTSVTFSISVAFFKALRVTLGKNVINNFWLVSTSQALSQLSLKPCPFFGKTLFLFAAKILLPLARSPPPRNRLTAVASLLFLSLLSFPSFCFCHQVLLSCVYARFFPVLLCWRVRFSFVPGNHGEKRQEAEKWRAF